ncbi:MAG: aminoacyl-tRNA hydrolase [Syntrophaceae bacterium]|nr:aminoacyl-tRNA hydrolase [Syntrophaceae bacterium]
MYLIAGLGNPGNRYRFTRHNIGFMVLEKLAQKFEIDVKQKSFDALWGKGKVNNTNVLLAMPQTYMNLSGAAVRQLVAFFKADVNNLIVIHDDLDLPFGTIRLKTGGGNAGHKGLASITENLGSSDFIRVRLGIGRPSDKSRIEGYVLEPFNSDEELSMLPEIIQTATDAVSEIVLSGTEKATAKCQKNILVNSLKKEEE